MELTGQKPRMICHFHHFDQIVVGATGNFQARCFQPGQVVVIDFVAVTMTLDNLRLP